MNLQPPDPPEYGHCLTCKRCVDSSEVRGNHCIECEGQAMNNATTGAEPLAALKAARQFIVNGTALGFIRMPEAETPDPAHDTLPMIERAIAALEAQPLEPSTDAVALTAVATLRDNGDGGLEPDWLLEGGTAELFEGMVLLVADQDQTLCEEDGHVELYRRPVQPLPFPGYPAVPEDRQLSAKCDGNHAAPACADPQCWNSDLVSAYIMTTTSHNKETGGTVYWFGRLDRADEMRPLKIEAAGPREAWDELSRQLSAGLPS